jgi:DNA-directed RNA polymerase specialized sigma24 family protein
MACAISNPSPYPSGFNSAGLSARAWLATISTRPRRNLCRRQAHTLGVTLENCDVQLFFDLQNPPVKRRRRDVEALGRASDRPGAYDGITFAQFGRVRAK